MTNAVTPPASKLLTYTYILLKGTSILFSSAEAGKYDDIEVVPLNDATNCTQCFPCPIHEDIGDCGENFVKNSLLRKGVPAYSAQYDSVHGLDVVAFTQIKGTSLVILHESKMSGSTSITPSNFKNRLGKTNSGRQCSRTWLNKVLNNMDSSSDEGSRQLGSAIKYTLANGGYFVRTGNLRVDSQSGSYIQCYAITDKLSERKSLKNTQSFTSGPFLYRWRNQYKTGLTSQYQELPLNNYTISYLNDLMN